MNILDKFGEPEMASAALKDIRRLAGRMSSRTIKLMEVCGTHTNAIMRSGIPGLLPENVRLVSGPGCPVCVTPPELVDAACVIASREDVVLATFGDMLRVPGTRGSLEKVKSGAANIKILYSPAELIPLAREFPERRVVFFSVGFETTIPAISWTILHSRELGLKNLFIISANKLIPPALDMLACGRDIKVDGFICPGHVSVITGAVAYQPIVERYGIPCVIAGFEPLDVLISLRMLLLQLSEGKARVEIEYSRVVTEKGNEKARATIYEVFEPADSLWRGLGIMPASGLRLRPAYEHMDALREMGVETASGGSMPPGCACGEVLKGIKVPGECALFRSACNPEHPVGPCMISSEGTCAAHYKYGTD